MSERRSFNPLVRRKATWRSASVHIVALGLRQISCHHSFVAADQAGERFGRASALPCRPFPPAASVQVGACERRRCVRSWLRCRSHQSVTGLSWMRVA
jgi:hypothetical protein